MLAEDLKPPKRSRNPPNNYREHKGEKRERRGGKKKRIRMGPALLRGRYERGKEPTLGSNLTDGVIIQIGGTSKA